MFVVWLMMMSLKLRELNFCFSVANRGQRHKLKTSDILSFLEVVVVSKQLPLSKHGTTLAFIRSRVSDHLTNVILIFSLSLAPFWSTTSERLFSLEMLNYNQSLPLNVWCWASGVLWVYLTFFVGKVEITFMKAKFVD